jgi:hypothetical protein
MSSVQVFFKVKKFWSGYLRAVVSFQRYYCIVLYCIKKLRFDGIPILYKRTFLSGLNNLTAYFSSVRSFFVGLRTAAVNSDTLVVRGYSYRSRKLRLAEIIRWPAKSKNVKQSPTKSKTEQ